MLCALAIGAWVVALCIVAREASVPLAAQAVLFAAPGIILAARFLDVENRLEILALGSTLGFGIQSAVVVAARLIWPSADGGVVLLPVLVAAFTIVAWGRASLAQWRRREWQVDVTLPVILLLVVGALIAPHAAFAFHAERDPEFRALQCSDLLHHVVTTIELERAIPPENPYFAGEHLHYYWLAHVFPSSARVTAIGRPSAGRILTGALLVYGLLLVVTLHCLIAAWFPRTKIGGLLIVLALFASGYTYLMVPLHGLVLRWPQNPLMALVRRFLLTDDWGSSYSGFSHGWFRLLLVEPHGTLAFASLLAATLVMTRHSVFPRRPAPAMILGGLLCLPLAMDSFLAGLFLGSWMILGAVMLIRVRDGSILRAQAIVLATAAIVVGAMIALEMVTLHHANLVIKPYLSMLAALPFYAVFDLGLISVLGILGIKPMLRAEPPRAESGFLITLGIVSLIAMYAVRSPDVATVVFRKAATALRLPLLFCSGFCVGSVLQRPVIRKGLLAAFAVALVIALPSAWVDGFRLAGLVPDGSRAIVVPRADFDAYLWLRANTARDAVIQELPGDLSAIPLLAERRTPLGEWVNALNFGVGASRVEERHREIFKSLFLGENPQRAEALIDKYGIQYLFVGEQAMRELSTAARSKFDRISSLEKVFDAGGATVYKHVPSFE